MGYQRQNDLKLEGMKETVSNLTQRVNLIESDVAMSKVERRTNLSFSTVSLFRSLVMFLCCSVSCLYTDGTPLLSPRLLEKLYLCVFCWLGSSLSPHASSVMWMAHAVLVPVWKWRYREVKPFTRASPEVLGKDIICLLLGYQWSIWSEGSGVYFQRRSFLLG